MKKIKSDSMNRYSPGNQVVDALNTNSSSNIQGMINRNDGKIDYSFLSAVISAYYFSDKRNKYTKKQVIEVTNDLQKKFNTLTTDDLEWLDHNYTEKEIQAIIFCFVNNVQDSKSIKEMIDGCSDIDGKYFALTANGHIKSNLKERMENNLERIRDIYYYNRNSEDERKKDYFQSNQLLTACILFIFRFSHFKTALLQTVTGVTNRHCEEELQTNTLQTKHLLSLQSIFAGDERIELPPKVLETPIIPFDQSPVSVLHSSDDFLFITQQSASCQS